MKRKGSSRQQFVKRIPADLRERMVGMKLAIPAGDKVATVTVTPKMEIIRFSLGTSEPSEVKDRQAGAAAYVEQVFRSLRENRPITLTHRQAVALAGALYRSWAGDLEDGSTISLIQTDDGGWERDDRLDMEEIEGGYISVLGHLERLQAADDVSALERTVGALVNRLLLDRGVASVDEASRKIVLSEALKGLREGMEARKRKAGGDYSPDPQSERFPEWKQPGTRQANSSVSLNGLLDSWWREAKSAGLSESTHESYGKAISALAAFLGHDDAVQVTHEDILRFKDHLLATANPRTGKSISAKTVKDSYLSGLKSVFGWAETNRKIASNPATGITIKLAKKTKLRETWFTEAEIVAILSASGNVRKAPKEAPQRYALKRWVPWLCAYTGARVGEMVQLRKQDLRQEGDVWIISITPEAGRVKNKQRREIPLHPHLVALGFPKFVLSAPDGHLFMWSGEDRAAWRSAKNRLTDFVRTVVTDPNVQPNHGWRHTFKTIGSEAGIQDKVLDAICGHDPRTVGEGYGGVTLTAKARAMKMFPRFMV